MNGADFDLICKMLKCRSGLILSVEKAYLLESRLRPVIRKYGLADMTALVERVRRQDIRIIADITDAMTTNETSFFRDLRPFSAFRETVLPALMANRAAKKSFRILCAAASTGQEPYSLAIILAEEAVRLRGWSCEIVAIDISATALERARAGVYSQFEIQRGMPTPLLLKYFRRTGEDWQIADELRAMVRFREFNLLNELTPFGSCDVVFCRNVLIYFDRETKARTLQNLSRRIPQDGALVLGASETVMGLSESFTPMSGSSGIYRPLLPATSTTWRTAPLAKPAGRAPGVAA